MTIKDLIKAVLLNHDDMQHFTALLAQKNPKLVIKGLSKIFEEEQRRFILAGEGNGYF